MVVENPVTLTDKWPSLGSGSHSDATKRHHEWFKYLACTVKDLVARVEQLESENKRLMDQNTVTRVESLEKENKQLKEKLSKIEKNERSNDGKTSVMDWSSLMKPQNLQQASARQVITSIQKETERRESNVVIYGIPVSQEMEEEDKENHDREEVNRIFNILDID